MNEMDPNINNQDTSNVSSMEFNIQDETIEKNVEDSSLNIIESSLKDLIDNVNESSLTTTTLDHVNEVSQGAGSVVDELLTNNDIVDSQELGNTEAVENINQLREEELDSQSSIDKISEQFNQGCSDSVDEVLQLKDTIMGQDDKISSVSKPVSDDERTQTKEIISEQESNLDIPSITTPNDQTSLEDIVSNTPAVDPDVEKEHNDIGQDSESVEGNLDNMQPVDTEQEKPTEPKPDIPEVAEGSDNIEEPDAAVDNTETVEDLDNEMSAEENLEKSESTETNLNNSGVAETNLDNLDVAETNLDNSDIAETNLDNSDVTETELNDSKSSEVEMAEIVDKPDDTSNENDKVEEVNDLVSSDNVSNMPTENSVEESKSPMQDETALPETSVENTSLPNDDNVTVDTTKSSTEKDNEIMEVDNLETDSIKEVLETDKDANIESEQEKDKENEDSIMDLGEDIQEEIMETENPLDETIKDDDSSNKIDDSDVNADVLERSPQSEKDKVSDSDRCDEGQDVTEFVQVNTESKDGSEKDDSESNKGDMLEQDPIASDTFEQLNEDREGADEELCIIPDTERVISQAEKDAASSIPPLRDIADEISSNESSGEQSSVSPPIIIFKYEKDDLQVCTQCMLQRKVLYCFTKNDSIPKYICDDQCLDMFKKNQTEKVAMSWEEGVLRVKNFTGSQPKEASSVSYTRVCACCKKITNDVENNLTWEIMDFCNEFCLSKYQKEIGSRCSSCIGEVKSNSLGKYCVRFGNDIRQFCTSHCLEEYKKGLKVCSYCQQDMSGGPEGFLAPVGDKGQFKDFCSQLCMEKYDIMTNDRPPKVSADTKCSVCKTNKQITIEFELDNGSNYFCSEPCFVAFSFVNNITPGKCAMCRRNFSKKTLEKNTMYYDNVQHSFCSNSCQNIYIIAHRKIVPCSWCKVKKYNFDMIRRYSKTGPQINMCSVNCLSLYQVSLNAVKSKKTTCNYCHKNLSPMYHLTMSDATIRNFCSYNCVMSFQSQFPKTPITLNNIGEHLPVPTGAPRKNKKTGRDETETPTMPVITSVQSLANTNGTVTPVSTPIQASNVRTTRSKSNNSQILNQIPPDIPVQIQVRQHFIVRPAPVPDQKNAGTMCRVRSVSKGTSAKPLMVNQECQTDEREAEKILIPVPVPIYVPTPCHMFTAPVPVPVPFPLPIPIPIFIPTTRNSATGIMKEIKKIQAKIPTDPYEAELLMMAEMVAEEKKQDNTDSESDVDDTAGAEDNTFSPEPPDASNTFGDDMLQMALKMATELDEPAVDLEGALTANTITAPQGADAASEESVDDPQPMHHMMERTSLRGRKRGMRQGRPSGAKRGRRMSHQVDIPMMPQAAQPAPPPEPAEKPDANMCLKYTFGVNAWKQWVTTKNTELEKSSRLVKLFKTEILQLTADELNYSLCLFVKEVRKPNGAEYAPDTIYYLCLGIQQYLFENGRIDNIFCDPYYEKFTDCLDEVAKKFSVLYNDSHYIVTRVEEEHLWESKQLGAHSPHVLLSTLMFFNTKHFNLTSVDEHMQLSFSHIMKHWKRNPNQPGASKMTGNRNVLLRFYPPQTAIQNNARKKKVYEQQENEENPLRCPVKLYEFYLSKCPESVKTRNDVFYLQPERSCVPDSPVWYSTMPLPREALEKMLHRVKMVKEINVALLTS